MSAADVSFSYIPAKLETGLCRACHRASSHCGFVVWRKRKCLLCSECRLILAGEWRAVDPLNMSACEKVVGGSGLRWRMTDGAASPANA